MAVFYDTSMIRMPMEAMYVPDLRLDTPAVWESMYFTSNFAPLGSTKVRESCNLQAFEAFSSKCLRFYSQNNPPTLGVEASRVFTLIF